MCKIVKWTSTTFQQQHRFVSEGLTAVEKGESRGSASLANLSSPSLLLPPYLAGGGAAAVRQCGSAGPHQLASYGSPAGGTEIAHSLQT